MKLTINKDDDFQLLGMNNSDFRRAEMVKT